MPYEPINNYGVVGNMRTAALVSTAGSIDWMCYPCFDAPSIFGSLLDHARGGCFKISARDGDAGVRQSYLRDTNVLSTRFLSSGGAGEVIDFMPLPAPGRDSECRLVRLVKANRGTAAFRMECRPAFNYGRDPHQVEVVPEGALFCSPGLNLALTTQMKLLKQGDGVAADFVLTEGQTASFVLEAVDSRPGLRQPQADAEIELLLERTAAYWREWLAKCTYTGRWREMVHRSALVLELMAYAPTGAIVAAPTTSLPEAVGGPRNWDYRCSWIRDSGFTVYALLRVGLTDEADRFMTWIDSRCKELEQDGSLQTVYGIDGRKVLTEQSLNHWEGYRSSRPVRIGNRAFEQLQLDIYGELLDAVYLYNKYVTPISYELWSDLRRLTDWVANNWSKKDRGIWEVRNGDEHFVYSKVMCWVALDRALRLAAKRSFPADLECWTRARDAIYQQVLTEGWNPSRRAFTQFYGSDSLDASSLVMPLVFFMSPSDPKMLSTLDAILKPPSQGGLVSDGMVSRYNSGATADGLRAGEGTFNMCSFWLVEALTRAGRTQPERLKQACAIFDRMLGQSNHLGLYSEETGPSGEALGNFPQAFTHFALISAAFNLDRALG